MQMRSPGEDDINLRRSPEKKSYPAYHCVVHNEPVDLCCDYRGVLAGLRVVEVVELVHCCREFLLCLFVQIGNSDAPSE